MGFFVSSKQAVVIALLFIGICVAIGLLAGLMKPPPSVNNGGSNDGQKGDSTTTSSTTTPATTATTTEAPTPGTTEGSEAWHDPFLPRNLVPLHYDLYMNPDFYYDGSTFEGTVSIRVSVTETTRILIVHYKKLVISDTKVMLDGTELTKKDPFAYDKNEFWVIEMEDDIPANSIITMKFEFTGTLVDGILGFYKSTYQNSLDNNRESWLVTTQFQPTDARKAFPCFDEPRHKASFTIKMRHWANFTALSNMPNETSIADPHDSDFIITTFEESVPMSTYLVCFIVCDFSYVEDTLDGGKPHRIWAAPDKMNQVNYALQIGTAVANFFQKEFDMDYLLPKIDQIAIPDFSAGAMEHWGLITYRETRLLYNASLASASAKESVALVIAHELAHNYFGNAVTCEWWNELWLNEGFARFFQYIGIKDAEPSWLVDDYFAVRTQQGVMRTDAGANSRPIVIDVTHPDDINQAFDSITYDKGGSVLRMIQSFMGEDRFRNAMKIYLRKHENGTVVTQDLWNAIQEEMGSELNVTAVMSPWVDQMGLPVLNITQNGNQITATATRFMANPDADPSQPESDFGYQWYIPVTYRTSTNETGIEWVNKTFVEFPSPVTTDEWLKFNKEQRGFFRVNYPNSVWRQFANQMDTNHEIFSAIDRSNLLDDAFNLARATLLDYPTALGLTTYMSKEMDYFPWRTASSALNYINNQLYGEEDYYLWRRYVRELSENVMERLEVNGDDPGHLDNMLRGYIISLACNNGNTGCLDNTSSIFTRWINDRNFEVAPNIRQEVYMYGMREVGNEAEWDEMWRRYEEAESAQEALNLLRGMAQAPQLYLMQRYLYFCMDEKKVRSQDFFSAVYYAAASPHGELYVWNWVQEVYPELIDRFGIHDRYFGRFVPDIVKDFKTEFRLNEVKAFFAKYPEAGAGATSRKQAIESIENNIKWKALNEKAVFDWLKTHYSVQTDS